MIIIILVISIISSIILGYYGNKINLNKTIIPMKKSTLLYILIYLGWMYFINSLYLSYINDENIHSYLIDVPIMVTILTLCSWLLTTIGLGILLFYSIYKFGEWLDKPKKELINLDNEETLS